MPIVTLANLVLYILHCIHAWMVMHILTCDHDLITHVSSIFCWITMIMNLCWLVFDSLLYTVVQIIVRI